MADEPLSSAQTSSSNATLLRHSVIPIVNKLQSIFAHLGSQSTIELPQVAVVSSQSRGKSSVLEALVSRDFLPRGSNICTRRPLVLQLLQTKRKPDGFEEEYEEFLHFPSKRFYDFNEIRREIQFADDSLILCEADALEVRNVKKILRCFEMLSGLKINYHKSVVSGVGVPNEDMFVYASVLNCAVKSLPFQYLGLPLGANPRRKASWRPVLAKFRSKLAGWKRKLLSFAGRLTLIKSVLSSLPLYYLSLFKLPQGVARDLDKLQASFLWGGSE